MAYDGKDWKATVMKGEARVGKEVKEREWERGRRGSGIEWERGKN